MLAISFLLFAKNFELEEFSFSLFSSHLQQLLSLLIFFISYASPNSHFSLLVLLSPSHSLCHFPPTPPSLTPHPPLLPVSLFLHANPSRPSLTTPPFFNANLHSYNITSTMFTKQSIPSNASTIIRSTTNNRLITLSHR